MFSVYAHEDQVVDPALLDEVVGLGAVGDRVARLDLEDVDLAASTGLPLGSGAGRRSRRRNRRSAAAARGCGPGCTSLSAAPLAGRAGPPGPASARACPCRPPCVPLGQWMISTPFLRAAAIRSFMRGAISATRAVAPWHQCLSHMSQITIAVLRRPSGPPSGPPRTCRWLSGFPRGSGGAGRAPRSAAGSSALSSGTDANEQRDEYAAEKTWSHGASSFEAPNPKSQISNKSKAPNRNVQNDVLGVLDFVFRSLGVV